MNKISNKELESVSTMGAFDRYRYFIKKIADSSTFWILMNKQDEYALSDVDNKILLSMWSAEEYTKSCMTGVWKNYIPRCLDIDKLNDELLPFITEKNYLIDVFPVNSKAGFVVTVDEFVHDLNVELNNYE
jgi:Protein of unknown function (DUF2750)